MTINANVLGPSPRTVLMPLRRASMVLVVALRRNAHAASLGPSLRVKAMHGLLRRALTLLEDHLIELSDIVAMFFSLSLML